MKRTLLACLLAAGLATSAAQAITPIEMADRNSVGVVGEPLGFCPWFEEWCEGYV